MKPLGLVKQGDTGSDPERIELGGRAFRFTKRDTLPQRMLRARLLRRGGLADLHGYPGEPFEEYRERAGDLVAESGIMLDLIALEIVPFGKAWSPEAHEGVVRFLGWIEPTEHIDALNVLMERMHRRLFAGPPLDMGGGAA